MILKPIGFLKSGETDPYWDDVVLLLPFDTDVQDDSSAANTVTAFGTAAVSATQSKFGGKSCYFDGDDDYLEVDYSVTTELGTGPVTWEAWVYPLSLPSSGVGFSIASKYNTTDNKRSWNLLLYNNAGTQQIGMFLSTTGSSAQVLMTDYSMPTNQWSHYAICWTGSSLLMYVNGTLIDTVSFTGTIFASTEPIIIGAQKAGAVISSDFSGYIDDLRITKGVARYTENFTLPTMAFPTS